MLDGSNYVPPKKTLPSQGVQLEPAARLTSNKDTKASKEKIYLYSVDSNDKLSSIPISVCQALFHPPLLF
jgi:hypothetical protein